MFTEEYYEAESMARDVLASQGVDFGDEMSLCIETLLHMLTLEILKARQPF